MLFEYRSDDRECLQYMQDYFEKTVEKQRRKYTEEDGVNIKVTLLGARPCNGDTDVEKQRAFEQLHIDALKESLDMETKFKSASTDSNYPLSYGIPAFTIGTCVGIGTHTREEHIVKASLLPGMKYLMTLLSKFFEE